VDPGGRAEKPGTCNPAGPAGDGGHSTLLSLELCGDLPTDLLRAGSSIGSTELAERTAD
jgi:hypothetical protein